MDDLRVLIVEDDPMVMDIHKRFTMSIPGFSVVGLACNGKEALRVLEQREVDLVILDIFMPRMEGIETMKKIRSIGKDIDIILVTAAVEGDTVKQCMRLGAVDYILKPFKFERLNSTLENYRKLFHTRGEFADKYQQSDIDSLFIKKKEINTSGELPKGLQHSTLEIIIATMNKVKTPLSADEVASTCGISRVTARRYLEYLVYYNRAVIEPQYIKIGRPVNKYRYLK